MSKATRTNTFDHLAGLCDAKGIICERRGRKIDLVTPDGSVTAECESVAEALDTFHHDTTFSQLPIKIRTSAKSDAYGLPTPHRAPTFEEKIAISDSRIAGAMSQLNGSERGRNALRGFKSMVKQYGADGLDMFNQQALTVLLQEVFAGRRDFLDNIR